MRKKIILLALLFIISYCFSACESTITGDIEVKYQQTYEINDDKLNTYTELEWQSDNVEVATVDNGVINAISPGTANIIALQDTKEVANFSVTVTIEPIKNIVLSTNSIELIEDETYQLSYTLFPENASEYGLQWKSADDSVATVDDFGNIVGIRAGQTTISLSNADGIIATCSVIVGLKPAYERLTAQEKEFVDVAIKHIGQFKNPNSVVIRGIQKDAGGWAVEVSAQNGFGGNGIEQCYLYSEVGFWNYKSLNSKSKQKVEVKPDSIYDVALINEAIQELLS